MTKLIHDPMNIVICGIGGQGNIVASGLLGSALVEKGYRVSVGETYGASQRGGSVMSHVRASETRDLGVLCPKGKADIIVGFEPLEALRIAKTYGNENTIVIYDDRQTYPLGVLIGEDEYPSLDQISAELKKLCSSCYVVPATEIAIEAGSSKSANIVLMGALVALPQSPCSTEEYFDAMSQNFSGKVLEMNKKAFQMGYDALAKQL